MHVSMEDGWLAWAAWLRVNWHGHFCLYPPEVISGRLQRRETQCKQKFPFNESLSKGKEKYFYPFAHSWVDKLMFGSLAEIKEKWSVNEAEAITEKLSIAVLIFDLEFKYNLKQKSQTFTRF